MLPLSICWYYWFWGCAINWITERTMIKGIIWKKKTNLDHLVIPFQCAPQVASWKEERGTLQDRIGNMVGLCGLSGRREGRQYLSQPVHWATIPSVQRTLCKISLLLLINTTEKIESSVLWQSRNEGILKAVIARNAQPIQYTAWRVFTGLSSAST